MTALANLTLASIAATLAAHDARDAESEQKEPDSDCCYECWRKARPE